MHQTVSVIFEDPGVQELLVKLYQKGKINTVTCAGVSYVLGCEPRAYRNHVCHSILHYL